MRFENFDALLRFLRGFTNLNGDPAPYDVVAVAHLLAAIAENLDTHCLDADFADAIPDALGEDGIAALRRLVSRLEA